MTKTEVLKKYGLNVTRVNNEEADDNFIDNVKKLAEFFEEIFHSCDESEDEV